MSMNTTFPPMEKGAAAISIERWGIATIMVALLAPLLTALGCSFSVPVQISMLAALSLAAIACPWLARRLPREWDGLHRKSPGWCILWLAVGLASVLRLAGVTWFMIDPYHPQTSVYWFDPFYIQHNCFSAYWKGAQLARAHVADIYDTSQYMGDKVGPFWQDPYNYVPQFLLLPRLAIASGSDFYHVRTAWFAIEAALMLWSMFMLCRWCKGDVGRRLALWIPAMCLSSAFLATLQFGNFEMMCFALAAVGMCLFELDRPIFGGALLALAGLKLFPLALGLYLLITRRWSAAFWTAAFSALYCILTYLWMGPGPFLTFMHDDLPNIASGNVWAFLLYDGPVPDLETINVNAINISVPGLVMKLNTLGVKGMTLAMMGKVAWTWTAVLFGLIIVSARRHASMSRLEQVTSWMAILTLAAYRVPFSPDVYGLIAPLWLLLLLMSAAPMTWRRLPWAVLAWLALGTSLPFGGTALTGFPRMAVSTGVQFLAIGLSVWVLLRRPSKYRAHVDGTEHATTDLGA
jgi:Glycosyltransferase family 87